MYGFWRLGVMPAPSGGATWVANGLATATRRNEKNTETPAKTGTTHTTRLRAQLRLSRTATAPKVVSTRSQRRSDPSCPPQNAEIVYAVGSASLVVRATYVNEKSFRRSASRTPAATSVEKNAAERVLREKRQAAPPRASPRRSRRRARIRRDRA